MDNCRFCEIVNGDFKDEQLVYQTDGFIVITDKYRKTSVGAICLIIPKRHVKNLLELNESEEKELMPIIKLISKSMQQAYKSKGIRIWAAINKEAGQSIFHCHIHIVPCKSLKDRLKADFPGFFDLMKKILGKRELSKQVNFRLAENLRNEIYKTNQNPVYQQLL